jgi:UDP-N-acetylmuramate: L-alanyl-gamma-D-glutamyl-meso-diaminopimelate ligase
MVLQNKNHHIAIVYPSGKLQKSAEDKINRIKILEQEGFCITDIEPVLNAPTGVTAAPVIERAALLSHALTNRKFDILMAARGGYGSTELIPYLELMLPPILPAKTLVGFSDISYLGAYLSHKFPNFRYIHAKNMFSDDLFLTDHDESATLLNLIRSNNQQSPDIQPTQFTCRSMNFTQTMLTGVCVPFNLSLAESFSATKHTQFPKNAILFLEDCNEYLHRLLRKFDSLINSGLMDNVIAIVLGEFSQAENYSGNKINREELLKLIAKKMCKPLIDFPFFGHGKYCFPLVSHSTIIINRECSEEENTQAVLSDACLLSTVSLTLTHQVDPAHRFYVHETNSIFAHHLEKAKNIHLSGIGGTGMASVAGLLKKAGYQVSGSDNTIYPPMDKVLSDLEIVPDVGFRKENISSRHIDAIIMGNVMSRKTASLQKNEELEEIFERNVPVMSFPSALRQFFLKQSAMNIVVSGTHGKTTTSSLFAWILTDLGNNPSFLIGGMPGNFGQGFALNSRDLFVLEGDEYDSALFDKGPKFLHYEPHITIINNIEFDHADIYPTIEAIENEFLNLAVLTHQRNGFNIINWDDPRAREIAKKIGKNVITFGSEIAQEPSPFPHWLLRSFKIKETGTEVQFTAPDQTHHKLFCAQIFGLHNAMNVLSVLAGMHAYYLLGHKTLGDLLANIQSIEDAFSTFKGIKRRFELIGHKNNISVFDDFAHHPTAVKTTLDAFRSYIEIAQKKGRLIVCFDPHNATLRRNVLQDELAKSFGRADLLFLGKVPKDLRLESGSTLDAHYVVQNCGITARYFEENAKLLAALKQEVQPSDTIVFMSSGAFDGIAKKFINLLETEAV